MARRGRRSRELAWCLGSTSRCEITRRLGLAGRVELARGIERLRSRREASIVAATRVVTTSTTRACVEVTFAGSARGSACSVAFTTLIATAATTPTATRPASSALAAITLGALLLTVTCRLCD